MALIALAVTFGALSLTRKLTLGLRASFTTVVLVVWMLHGTGHLGAIL